ncbi:hypothetical protein RB195_004298 [Necator americanus]|uniref:Uncharacterized protein n=1 Tax=Necator americanus TaxID=51031 RepID=A0ABR1BKS6_NECAM
MPAATKAAVDELDEEGSAFSMGHESQSISGIPTPKGGANVCSLTFMYNRNYCTATDARSVESIVAGFGSIPEKLKPEREFCIVSRLSTTCFCSGSCNKVQMKSIVNALQKSRTGNYNPAYFRYDNSFIIVSRRKRIKIIDCLINEFGSNRSRTDRNVNTKVLNLRIVRKRQAQNGGKNNEKEEEEKDEADDNDGGKSLLYKITIAGGLSPLLMVVIAFCVLNTMEKKRAALLQGGEVVAEGEGVPGEGEPQGEEVTPGTPGGSIDTPQVQESSDTPQVQGSSDTPQVHESAETPLVPGSAESVPAKKTAEPVKKTPVPKRKFGLRKPQFKKTKTAASRPTKGRKPAKKIARPVRKPPPRQKTPARPPARKKR